MKKQLVFGVLFIMMLSSVLAAFSDDFNRPDDTTIGNSWSETCGGAGCGTADISISSNALYFTPSGGSFGISARRDFTAFVPSSITYDANIVDGGGGNAGVVLIAYSGDSACFGLGFYNGQYTLWDDQGTDYTGVNLPTGLISIEMIPNFDAQTVTYVLPGNTYTGKGFLQACSEVDNIRINHFFDWGGPATLSIDNLLLSEATCTPDWSCTSYDNNECPGDGRYCDEVTDNNNCGVEYTGDYTEFPPLDCDCGTQPFSGCEVSVDTTFDTGSYNVSPNGISVLDGVSLDCNWATLSGDYTLEDEGGTYLIRTYQANNVEISNCYLTHARTGIHIGQDSNYAYIHDINFTDISIDAISNTGTSDYTHIKDIVSIESPTNNGNLWILGDNALIENVVVSGSIGVGQTEFEPFDYPDNLVIKGNLNNGSDWVTFINVVASTSYNISGIGSWAVNLVGGENKYYYHNLVIGTLVDDGLPITYCVDGVGNEIVGGYTGGDAKKGTCAAAPTRSTGSFHQCNINPNCRAAMEQQSTSPTYSLVGGEKFNLFAWIDNLMIRIRAFFGLKG